MPATREEVFQSAMQLSEADRFQLATELLDTVSDDIPGVLSVDDPGFFAELERRTNDGSPGIPWEQVQAQLQADFQS